MSMYCRQIDLSPRNPHTHGLLAHFVYDGSTMFILLRTVHLPPCSHSGPCFERLNTYTCVLVLNCSRCSRWGLYMYVGNGRTARALAFTVIASIEHQTGSDMSSCGLHKPFHTPHLREKYVLGLQDANRARGTCHCCNSAAANGLVKAPTLHDFAPLRQVLRDAFHGLFKCDQNWLFLRLNFRRRWKDWKHEIVGRFFKWQNWTIYQREAGKMYNVPLYHIASFFWEKPAWGTICFYGYNV